LHVSSSRSTDDGNTPQYWASSEPERHSVGETVGDTLGELDGEPEGAWLGDDEGDSDGDTVGLAMGSHTPHAMGHRDRNTLSSQLVTPSPQYSISAPPASCHLCQSLQVPPQISVVGDTLGEVLGDTVGSEVVGDRVGDAVGWLQTLHV
jgi:hypothetical protein